MLTTNYLKLLRYILGVCSILLCVIGVPFIIFMPPLWFVFPLFVYLIFLNFNQPKRILDQFDLIQICIWLIVLCPHEYFVIINIVLLVFIFYKTYQKQSTKCYLMLGFCIVFLITQDLIAMSTLILLCVFSLFYDVHLSHKISSASASQ